MRLPFLWDEQVDLHFLSAAKSATYNNNVMLYGMSVKTPEICVAIAIRMKIFFQFKS